MTGKSLRLIVLLISLPVLPASADIYRCDTDDGTVFSEEPCGDQARRIILEEADTAHGIRPAPSSSGTGDSAESTGTAPGALDRPDSNRSGSGAADGVHPEPDWDALIESTRNPQQRAMLRRLKAERERKRAIGTQ